jgi:hypothetical protein
MTMPENTENQRTDLPGPPESTAAARLREHPEPRAAAAIDWSTATADAGGAADQYTRDPRTMDALELGDAMEELQGVIARGGDSIATRDQLSLYEKQWSVQLDRLETSHDFGSATPKQLSDLLDRCEGRRSNASLPKILNEHYENLYLDVLGAVMLVAAPGDPHLGKWAGPRDQVAEAIAGAEFAKFVFGKPSAAADALVSRQDPELVEAFRHARESNPSAAFDVLGASLVEHGIDRFTRAMILDPARAGLFIDDAPSSNPDNASWRAEPLQQDQFELRTRTFAPFRRFGSGSKGIEFEGDSRGPSSRLDVSSRITQKTVIDVPPGATEPTIGANDTYSDSTTMYSFGLELGKGTAEPTSTAEMRGGMLRTALEGSMPLLPLMPEIDVKSDLVIKRDGNVLAIEGNMRGDRFPSAETLLTDRRGQSILLHAYNTDGGTGAPLLRVPGDGNESEGTYSVLIQLDDAGAFMAVRDPRFTLQAEPWRSVDEWNRDRMAK